MFFLPQCPKGWDYKNVPPHLVSTQHFYWGVPYSQMQPLDMTEIPHGFTLSCSCMLLIIIKGSCSCSLPGSPSPSFNFSTLYLFLNLHSDFLWKSGWIPPRFCIHHVTTQLKRKTKAKKHYHGVSTEWRIKSQTPQISVQSSFFLPLKIFIFALL